MNSKNSRAPPQRQRPGPQDHNNNTSSSGHLSPMPTERIQNAFNGNQTLYNAKTQTGKHSQMQYELAGHGGSPSRKPHGASTLDEVNSGSPVPSRHELSQPPQYYSASGQQSPKLTSKQAGAGAQHGERSQQRPQKMQQRDLNGNQGSGGNRQHRLAKSYNMDSVSQRITDREKHMGREQRTSQGNIIALACGPLKRRRYINPKIELELVDFKKEIEEKFAKSPLKKFQMPRKSEVEQTNEMGQGIFSHSRVQKGRQLAQSTDASIMQQYLQQTQSNANHNSSGQFQMFNGGIGANGQGYPVIAPNSQRKGMVGKAKQQIISADYSMNVAQSQNNSQLQNLVKNLNSTNSSSSRNIINQTEQLASQIANNRQGAPQMKPVRNKIGKPPKYDGSASRYGNFYENGQSDVRGPHIQKPHHLEELNLRQTHYGGAVDKLLTTQKIGSGFKGINNQMGSHGNGAGNQVTPSGYRPQPINFNKNTFQDLYQQQTQESVKATRVPNISNKTRHQKQLQNHLYNAGDGIGRDSPANMPKLQKISHNNSGGSGILSKAEHHMRSTHLKLEPIESVGFGNPSGMLTTNGNDPKHVNQSVQFQKGILTPLDARNQGGGQKSPQIKKHMVANHMNATMYRNHNQGLNQSQNQAPRRINELLSPLTAFEIEREQTQQRIFSTYIMPNQAKGSGGVNPSQQQQVASQIVQHQVSPSSPKNQPRQGMMQLQSGTRGGMVGQLNKTKESSLPKVSESQQLSSSYYGNLGGANSPSTSINQQSPMPQLRPDQMRRN